MMIALKQLRSLINEVITGPRKLEISELPVGAFEMYLDQIQYGGSDPAFANAACKQVLQDNDVWDPEHGDFYDIDGKIVAHTYDYRGDPLTYQWTGSEWIIDHDLTQQRDHDEYEDE